MKMWKTNKGGKRPYYFNYLFVFFLLAFFESKAQYFEPIGNGIGIDSVTNPNDGVFSLCADTGHQFLGIFGRFNSADGDYFNGSCNWDGIDYDNMVFVGSNGIDYNAVMWNQYMVVNKNNAVLLFDSTQMVLNYFPGLGTGTAYVQDMINYNGDLYIAGGFYLDDGTIGIAKWNDTDSVWETVGGGLTGSISYFVNALGIYNGDLIAAGQFNEIGGVAATNIARWDGNQWHAMGGGIEQTSSLPQIRAILEFNGNLFVTGDFNIVNSINCTGFVKWNGSGWSVPTNSPSMGNGFDLEIYHNKLYNCGYFYYNGDFTAAALYSYDGNNFQLFYNYTGDNSTYSMEVFDNYLYLGGAFLHLGDSVIANRIGRFSDSVICVPFVVNFNGEQLTVTTTGSVQWFNCDNGSIITGATNNAYSPTSSGNYAAIVTEGNCYDTTECFNYTGTNEFQIADNSLQIYPNPANETLSVKVDNIKEIIISNMLGEVVQKLKFKVQRPYGTIDISKLPQGIYLLRVQNNDGWQVGKVVKE